ncbi:MAG TPA: hypothetical protein VMW66_01770 [Elusimicrobiales bacterium]|nr:hypothetical protein [Elusimicrobiales bacterium]
MSYVIRQRLAYGYGKPNQRLQLAGENGQIQIIISKKESGV